MIGWFGILALFLYCGAPLAPPDTEIVEERFGAWAIVGNDNEILSSEPSTSEAMLQNKPDTVRKMVQAAANSVRFVNDERNEEELSRLIQNGWKILRAAALGSIRAVRKLYDPRGIPSDGTQRALIQLQRERYMIQREVKPEEVFNFSVARSLLAK